MDFRTGSGGGSGDEQEASNTRKGRKSYHRHTAQQIEQLETYVRSTCNSKSDTVHMKEVFKFCLICKEILVVAWPSLGGLANLIICMIWVAMRVFNSRDY